MRQLYGIHNNFTTKISRQNNVWCVSVSYCDTYVYEEFEFIRAKYDV